MYLRALLLVAAARAFVAPGARARPTALGASSSPGFLSPLLEAFAPPAPAPVADDDGGARVEWPKPLSGPQRLLRAASFYSRVVPVLARY